MYQIPSGEILISVLNTKLFQIRNPYTGEIIRNLTGYGGTPESFAYLPKQGVLASASSASRYYNRKIEIWNITNGDLIKTINSDYIQYKHYLFVSPNGLLASFSGAYNYITLKIFNPDNNFELEKDFKYDPFNGITGIAFLKDGNIAISDASNPEGNILILNPNNGTAVRKISNAHSRGIYSIAAKPNGDIITSSDNGIKIWSGSDYSLKKLILIENACFSLLVLPIDYLACGTYNYTLIWDINTGEIKQRLIADGAAVSDLFLLKNGELVTGGYYSMEVWSTTGNILFLRFLFN